MGMINRAAFALALMVFGLGLALLGLEVFVRVLPPSITKFRRLPIFAADTDLGYRYRPHQKAVSEAGCYRIDPVTINSEGFRDDEWPDSAEGGVAILGDSYVEGVHVDDDETVAARLRAYLGRPVLNAGITGYGTISAEAVYEKEIRPRKPSVVALFFLTFNDITDNDCRFQRAGDGSVLKTCVDAGSEGDKIEKGFFVKQGAIRDFFRSSCMSCRYLMQIRETLSSKFGSKASGSAARAYASYQFDIYREPASEELDHAWQITERAIVRLRDKVEADGSKFVLLSVPDFARVSRDWKAELGKQVRDEVPVDINPEYPLNRLQEIASRHSVAFLPLEHAFKEYRDRHALEYPYFSFACDGHWNPLGHDLAAQILASHVLQSESLSFDATEQEARLKSLQELMSIDPKNRLGHPAYEAIYEDGRYTGGALRKP